jgi:hypothetical protein
MRFWVVILCVAVCAGLPVRMLEQIDSEVMWPTGAVNGVDSFVKWVYAEIGSADVKSLVVKFTPAYVDICNQVGKRLVESELRMLYDLRMNDLELTTHQMRKLGLLLNRLSVANQGKPSSDD